MTNPSRTRDLRSATGPGVPAPNAPSRPVAPATTAVPGSYRTSFYAALPAQQEDRASGNLATEAGTAPGPQRNTQTARNDPRLATQPDDLSAFHTTTAARLRQLTEDFITTVWTSKRHTVGPHAAVLLAIDTPQPTDIPSPGAPAPGRWDLKTSTRNVYAADNQTPSDVATEMATDVAQCNADNTDWWHRLGHSIQPVGPDAVPIGAALLTLDTATGPWSRIGPALFDIRSVNARIFMALRDGTAALVELNEPLSPHTTWTSATANREIATLQHPFVKGYAGLEPLTVNADYPQTCPAEQESMWDALAQLVAATTAVPRTHAGSTNTATVVTGSAGRRWPRRHRSRS